MNLTKGENKSIIYVSICISIIFNLHKILRIFGEANIEVIPLWDFNLFELIYQVVFQMIYCYVMGYAILKQVDSLFFKKSIEIKLLIVIIILTLILWLLGSKLQLWLFKNVTNERLFYRVYLLRFILSGILMFIATRFLLLNKQTKMRELENEKLKSSYLNSKLENLKAQVNPHFLFNSFANLSALINQDQQKATKYLSNLSDVFRYALNNADEQIVDLIDELALLSSYVELYKIRVQDGLSLHIDLPDTKKKILHMSLQPLMENVIKHNEISKENPLGIYLKQQGDLLVFKNDLNTKRKVANSNGIGLTNLNERYKILMDKEIIIKKSEKHFIVELPLI